MHRNDYPWNNFRTIDEKEYFIQSYARSINDQTFNGKVMMSKKLIILKVLKNIAQSFVMINHVSYISYALLQS